MRQKELERGLNKKTKNGRAGGGRVSPGTSKKQSCPWEKKVGGKEVSLYFGQKGCGKAPKATMVGGASSERKKKPMHERIKKGKI